MSNTFDDALGAFEQAGFADDTESVESQPQADAPEVETESPTPEVASKDVDLSGLPEEAQIFLRARQREMQADYTRKTQELAAQRQEAEQYAQFVQALNTDPQFAMAVLERLQTQLQQAGFYQPAVQDEFGVDESDGYEDYESDPYVRELEELKSWKEQMEAEWENAHNEAIINRQIAEIRSAHPDYTQEDIEDVYALGFYTNGDLHAANEMFRGIIDRSLARYLETKRGVQTPAALPSGQGVPAPDDLRNADEKTLRAAALERLTSAINQ